ncbi:hypothetical protein [Caldimonas brevitalea]|uniref:Right handed beta helix domain-containing protein n=1 Tax=Caldimonas brevitalea TaxID=413882 RepID=A0A0G3BK79_9BURK|nr:hypothetical protein [Caldimonas brevitalea]AKJ29782.1 hypothetical protein AAW51_3091 [Caldimonas brevitalea]
MTSRTLRLAPYALTSMLALALSGCAVPLLHGMVNLDQKLAAAGGLPAGSNGCRDEPGFPITICRPGSYRLTENLVVPADTDAVEILADDVTLDLSGFSIAGPSTCEGSGADFSCSGQSGTGITTGLVRGLAVRNGVIHGMGGDGINCKGCTVEGVRARHNRAGFVVTSGLVKDSLASSNLIGVGLNRSSLVHSTVQMNHTGVTAANGGAVIGNVIATNTDVGLRIVGDGGYAQNSFRANQQADVDGGVNMGGNVCGAALCAAPEAESRVER